MSRRSVVAGVIAGVALLGFYIGVVGGASGALRHVADQARSDWYLLVLLTAGFGTQVALLVELRSRRRMQAAAAAAAGAGTGASALGMVACCAHHLADLVAVAGASAVATFLYDYRLAFVLVGVAINALGITVALRRLRHTPRLTVPVRSEPSAA